MSCCYKAVVNENGKLFSIFTTGQHKIEYKPGKHTTPELGLLCAFDKYNEAKEFMEEGGWMENLARRRTYEIWKCGCVRVGLMKRLLPTFIMSSNPDMVNTFWSLFVVPHDLSQVCDTAMDEAFCIPSPNGTILCESIKLVKCLKRYR